MLASDSEADFGSEVHRIMHQAPQFPVEQCVLELAPDASTMHSPDIEQHSFAPTQEAAPLDTMNCAQVDPTTTGPDADGLSSDSLRKVQLSGPMYGRCCCCR